MDPNGSTIPADTDRINNSKMTNDNVLGEKISKIS